MPFSSIFCSINTANLKFFSLRRIGTYGSFTLLDAKVNQYFTGYREMGFELANRSKLIGGVACLSTNTCLVSAEGRCDTACNTAISYSSAVVRSRG